MWKVLVVLVAASAVQATEWENVRHITAPDLRNARSRGLVDEHIVGGQEAIPHQFPYQVAITIKLPDRRTSFCGGSILTENIIITAAHCAQVGDTFDVIAGAHNLRQEEETQQIITTKVKKVHERYGLDGEVSNDVALLYLPEKLQLQPGIVEPIRLPSSASAGYWNKHANMSGWGWASDRSDVSPVLRYVESRIVSNFYCSARYLFSAVRSTHICVSGWYGKGTCHGDSGGPLAYTEADGKPTLIGITSFGIQFGCEKSWPTVFTRITSFLDWIHKNMEAIPQGTQQ